MVNIVSGLHESFGIMNVTHMSNINWKGITRVTDDLELFALTYFPYFGIS